MKNFLICISCLVSFTALAQNIPHPNIPAPKGLSVNSYTGNLFYQRTENKLGGTGYQIDQSFYYNTATDTTDYGYGRGWSFSYNIFYIQKDNAIIIQHSQAKKDTFLLSGQSYLSPIGVHDTLILSGSVVTLKSKNGTQKIFGDPSHKKITGMLDLNGNSITLDYSGSFPTKIRNSSGRCLLLNWQAGHLASATDSSNNLKTFSYTYNANGDLVSTTNPLNGKTSYTYTQHTLVKLADENNNPVLVTYGSGNKVKQINSCNTSQQFIYLKSPNITYVIQNGQAGSIENGFFFDTTGRIIAVSDANGAKTSYTYDANNNVSKSTDLKGATTTYSYDGNANLLQETDPAGNSVSFTYEPLHNRVNSIKDKKGNTTTYSYDQFGNLTTVVKPGGLQESFTYDANGRKSSSKDANGNITTYAYNADGNLITTQFPVGSLKYEYAGDYVSKIIDPNGSTVAMTYDILGRKTSLTDKAGNTTTYTYDAVGNVVKETDANNVSKYYTYDALNRLLSTTLPVGTWNYSYDGQSNMTKMTDANGHSVNYYYNNKNKLIKQADAINNSTSYSYDANGNILQKNYPNGNTVVYKYDQLNRLIQKDYPGNSDKFSYDASSNMTAAFNNNITYTFEYDNLNRLTKKNIVSWNKSIGYTYDAAGNRKTMTDQDGGNFNYQYDANSRLTSLTNAANLTTGFQYDDGGRIVKQNNANGTFTTYHYDIAGRMDSLVNWENNNNKLSFFYYTFDNNGNRKTMLDKHGLNTYSYDSSYRLSKVVYADGSIETFAMDGSGNRTVRTKNGVSTPYTYNAADQIQSAGASSFAFDANGNTTQQNDSVQRVFTYDGENRLLQVQLNGTKNIQYIYDPFGNKIEKVDTSNNTTKMVYDGSNLLGELNNSNTTVNEYTAAVGMDSWLSMATNGNNYFYHKDGQNSTTELTDNTGQLQNQYHYDVYGNMLDQSGIVNNNVLYTGRLFDNTTQLYDYRARFYNPNIGRFVNKDLASGLLIRPLTTNKYVYTQADPINFTDPLGLWTFSVGFAVTLPWAIYSISANFDGQGGSGIQVSSGSGYNAGATVGIFFSGTNASSISDLTGAGTISTGHSYGEPIGISFEPSVIRGTSGVTNVPYQGWSFGVDAGVSAPVGEVAPSSYFNSTTWSVTSNDLQNFTNNLSNINASSISNFVNQIGSTISNDLNLGNSVVGALINGIQSNIGLSINSVSNFLNNLFGGGSSGGSCSFNDPNGENPPASANGSNEPPIPACDTCKPSCDSCSNGCDSCSIPIPQTIINPGDPNYLLGTLGYDTTKRWVSSSASIPYKITFENDPDIATAPAQKVTIYVPIPPKLDPNSIRLSDFGFGRYNFTIPPNSSFYTTRLNVKDSLGVYVDVTAGLDIPNNRAFWTFQSIDPNSGLSSTLAPTAGFLPVDDSLTQKGEGYVNFTLQALSTAKTQDTSSAYGSIVFDNQPSLNTNNWLNTIDAVAPTSKINALPTMIDSVFTITWTGKDDSFGSGVKNYELYYSKNSGPYVLYKAGITDTTINFTGTVGAQYAFFTLATDNTGNKEANKTIADVITTITGNGVFLAAKAMLQGPYVAAENMMIDSLRTKGYLPLSQPYTALGFTPANNSNIESITNDILDSTGFKAITDWIWLELRSSADPKVIIATRSALIKRDGNIVDMDGVSPVYFNNVIAGDYYVVVRHRNHLGIMSANTLSFTQSKPAAIDFTDPAVTTYGSNAQKNINGIMTMWAGDANGNGTISYNGANNDKNAVLSNVGLTTANNVNLGYSRADCNLDGRINYNGANNDKNKVLSNVGLLTPNNTITQQIPK